MHADTQGRDYIQEHREMQDMRDDLIDRLTAGENVLSKEEKDNLIAQIRALAEMIELYEEQLDL